jgi:copper chaperone CopZ
MKQTLQINGMHCKSCEMLIKQSISTIPGCTIKSVSHKTGSCEIEYHQDNLSEVESAINQAGYTVGIEDEKQSRTSNQWIEKIAWLALA